MQMQRADRGYVTLLAVLVVGAFGAAIAMSVVLLGLSSSRSAFALEQSYQAKALADACMEEALIVIDTSTSFSGTATISLGLGSCTYTVTNTGGQNRTITSSGTVGTSFRKILVTVTAINPTVVSTWQENP